MGRRLDQGFLSAALNRGKAIECFLGAGDPYGEEPTIRWVNIRRGEEGFLARLYEMVDAGDAEFLDVYAFQSTADERDEPLRQERHDTLEEVLDCARRWGADSSRFVNEGMVGDEYGEYLSEKAR